ncbi:restriction endonuclease subunit S [Salinispirillum sp. LH 10-3-1]|uniref:Restriction endonuclease subunit S n=1 Tax=Salinispirillum sp. LH 10-3-1 TaxID=2952525 RepID=A0AB38YGP0_9GAMM
MTGSVTPPLWLTVPLENVILRIVGGGTPSKSKPEYYQGDIPWMSVKDMNKHVLQDTADHISQTAVDSSSTNVIPAGTPIIATRMSLGKIVVAEFDSAINQDLKALFLPTEIHRNFLVYWYRSVARQIEQMGTGTTVKGIRLEALKGLEFALPPLAEQKVIADKLDTLLAQVENTKARLKRIPKILKRFRQSVLAAAVSGRLTEEWRKRHDSNVPHEEPLSRTHCIHDEDQQPVPENWLLTAMGNVSTFQQGLQIAKSTRRMEPGESNLPILRTVNYENNFTDDVHYAVVNEKSIIAEPEDIILSRTGTVGLVLTGFKGIMHNNSFRLNFQKDLLLQRYLIYFLRSPICQEYVKRESGRSSQPDLTHKAFAKCPVTVPSRTEQTEIVRQVDQLFAHADRIEQQANNALARVNNLTQSILAKAFRGELTEQWRKDNPELISGENSAEALLARIKAERANIKPTNRTRKSKADA